MMIGKMNALKMGIHVSSINRSIAHKNEAMGGKKQAEEKITAVISPMGKRQNMIQQLMKQKQDLTDRMNSLSDSSLESGVDIRSQMEEYNKQLKALDEQILKLQSEQEDEEKSSEKSGIYEKPKTKEEAEKQRLNDIVNLTSGSDKAEVISSVKGKVDGRMSVLKAEVKTGMGNMEGKMKETAELEARSAELASQAGKQLQDVNDDAAYVHEESIKNEEYPEDVLRDPEEALLKIGDN